MDSKTLSPGAIRYAAVAVLLLLGMFSVVETLTDVGVNSTLIELEAQVAVEVG